MSNSTRDRPLDKGPQRGQFWEFKPHSPFPLRLVYPHSQSNPKPLLALLLTLFVLPFKALKAACQNINLQCDKPNEPQKER